jgi:apolipoprotein N-acyltransferase
MENGFSLVRPTYNGFSFAADYHGEIIAHMDSDETDTGIMYAQVPIKGIQTIYSKTGDVLGWICLLGVSVLALLSFKKK